MNNADDDRPVNGINVGGNDEIRELPTHRIGDTVLVRYREKKFPGKVVETEWYDGILEYRVSTMEYSGRS